LVNDKFCILLEAQDCIESGRIDPQPAAVAPERIKLQPETVQPTSQLVSVTRSPQAEKSPKLERWLKIAQRSAACPEEQIIRSIFNAIGLDSS